MRASKSIVGNNRLTMLIVIKSSNLIVLDLYGVDLTGNQRLQNNSFFHEYDLKMVE